ncbi:MAG: hypothetical protein KGQ48_06525 [Bradyrhizobium sp.]|nr:hypothetical protein [Bradyrhizobium sp.]
MRNRTAKYASIIAGLFAGVASTALLAAPPEPAADECLSAPKGPTPAGSHWYFRIEHPSNRHCWYLHEGGPRAQTVRPRSLTSAKPVAPKAETAMPGTVANARAELPSPRASLDQEKVTETPQLPAADAANAADTDNTPPSSPPAANMLSSVVASRWPDQLSANSPSPPPLPTTSVSAPVSAPVNAPAATQADATPEAQPVSVPIDAAQASVTEQSNSARMLLIVIVGALSFAGLVASAIVRFAGKRRRKQVRNGRRWTWDQERSDHKQPSPFPLEAARRPNIGLPRELQLAKDADEEDRITQMMARLARSARQS